MSKETAETLRKARDLIADPARWTQGTYARSSDRDVEPTSPDATCWCALGATERVTGICISKANIALSDAAHAMHNMATDEVNDTLGHAAILAVFDRAIANEEAAS